MDPGDVDAARTLYVLGIINLRGAVLPIVDMALRGLAWKPAEPTVRHVIIVAQVGPKVVGPLADAVSGTS